MTYKLFLDDVKMPSEAGKRYKDDDFVIVRDGWEFHEAIKEKGCPNFISWDYYLEGTMTTEYLLYDFLFMIQDGDLSLPDDFDYAIHSGSIEGTEKLESIFADFKHLFK